MKGPSDEFASGDILNLRVRQVVCELIDRGRVKDISPLCDATVIQELKERGMSGKEAAEVMRIAKGTFYARKKKNREVLESAHWQNSGPPLIELLAEIAPPKKWLTYGQLQTMAMEQNPEVTIEVVMAAVRPSISTGIFNEKATDKGKVMRTEKPNVLDISHLGHRALEIISAPRVEPLTRTFWATQDAAMILAIAFEAWTDKHWRIFDEESTAASMKASLTIAGVPLGNYATLLAVHPTLQTEFANHALAQAARAVSSYIYGSEVYLMPVRGYLDQTGKAQLQAWFERDAKVYADLLIKQAEAKGGGKKQQFTFTFCHAELREVPERPQAVINPEPPIL